MWGLMTGTCPLHPAGAQTSQHLGLPLLALEATLRALTRSRSCKGLPGTLHPALVHKCNLFAEPFPVSAC